MFVLTLTTCSVWQPPTGDVSAPSVARWNKRFDWSRRLQNIEHFQYLMCLNFEHQLDACVSGIILIS